MSGLPRQTVASLENESLESLEVSRVDQVTSVLGLSSAPLSALQRSKKRGLWMAAKTASISYASELTPDTLSAALVSGEIPKQFVPHLVHLLDEAPVPIVVMAVEETATLAQVPPKAVWRSVAKLAKTLAVHRQALWA